MKEVHDGDEDKTMCKDYNEEHSNTKNANDAKSYYYSWINFKHTQTNTHTHSVVQHVIVWNVNKYDILTTREDSNLQCTNLLGCTFFICIALKCFLNWLMIKYLIGKQKEWMATLMYMWKH